MRPATARSKTGKPEKDITVHDQKRRSMRNGVSLGGSSFFREAAGDGGDPPGYGEAQTAEDVTAVARQFHARDQDQSNQAEDDVRQPRSRDRAQRGESVRAAFLNACDERPDNNSRSKEKWPRRNRKSGHRASTMCPAEFPPWRASCRRQAWPDGCGIRAPHRSTQLNLSSSSAAVAKEFRREQFRASDGLSVWRAAPDRALYGIGRDCMNFFAGLFVHGRLVRAYRSHMHNWMRPWG